MGDYDDIINLAHHHSKTRPHMSMAQRAAQFMPFAALTGYGAVLEEIPWNAGWFWDECPKDLGRQYG